MAWVEEVGEGASMTGFILGWNIPKTPACTQFTDHLKNKRIEQTFLVQEKLLLHPYLNDKNGQRNKSIYT